MARDFTSYLAWGLDELLDRLARVTATLADLGELVAEAKSQELGSKADAYRASAGGSGPTAMRQVMSVEATPAAQTRLETEGQIEALREEKAFLLTLIDVRGRDRAMHAGEVRRMREVG